MVISSASARPEDGTSTVAGRLHADPWDDRTLLRRRSVSRELEGLHLDSPREMCSRSGSSCKPSPYGYGVRISELNDGGRNNAQWSIATCPPQAPSRFLFGRAGWRPVPASAPTLICQGDMSSSQLLYVCTINALLSCCRGLPACMSRRSGIGRPAVLRETMSIVSRIHSGDEIYNTGSTTVALSLDYQRAHSHNKREIERTEWASTNLHDHHHQIPASLESVSPYKDIVPTPAVFVDNNLTVLVRAVACQRGHPEHRVRFHWQILVDKGPPLGTQRCDDGCTCSSDDPHTSRVRR